MKSQIQYTHIKKPSDIEMSLSILLYVSSNAHISSICRHDEANRWKE